MLLQFKFPIFYSNIFDIFVVIIYSILINYLNVVHGNNAFFLIVINRMIFLQLIAINPIVMCKIQ